MESAAEARRYVETGRRKGSGVILGAAALQLLPARIMKNRVKLRSSAVRGYWAIRITAIDHGASPAANGEPAAGVNAPVAALTAKTETSSEP